MSELRQTEQDLLNQRAVAEQLRQAWWIAPNRCIEHPVTAVLDYTMWAHGPIGHDQVVYGVEIKKRADVFDSYFLQKNKIPGFEAHIRRWGGWARFVIDHPDEGVLWTDPVATRVKGRIPLRPINYTHPRYDSAGRAINDRDVGYYIPIEEFRPLYIRVL